MSKTRTNAPDRPVPGPQGHPDEEVVHVPKGTSPLRFILMLGLMLFVLVIFTVGDQLMSSVRQSGSDLPYMQWRHPSQGLVKVDWSDFQATKRSLDSFYYVTTGKGLGSDRSADEDIAYHLIMSDMAQEAGIEIPDLELARVINQDLASRFPNIDVYIGTLRQYDLSPQEFESTLRDLLRVSRYESLLVTSLGQPRPVQVEDAWKQAHEQFAFDLVGLEPADTAAEAETQVPDAEGLRAWYDALEATERSRLFFEHFTPVRSSAAILSWNTDDTPPQVLLERFPRPEGTDLEALARTYYDRFRDQRFARPQETATPPDENPPDEGEPPPTPPSPEAYSFEEVHDQALAEAQVHAALSDLRADLANRAAQGEELDLAPLAGELGLLLESDGQPHSRDEWSALAGDAIANAIAGTQPLSFWSRIEVADGRLALVRVLERKASEPPAFDEVTDEVRAAWIEDRSKSLVGEKLEALRAALAPPGEDAPQEGELAAGQPVSADAETFARVAEEAGLSVQHQEWFDPARRVGDEEALPVAERFLRSVHFTGSEVYTLEEGGISTVLMSFQDEHQWLVRSAGKREPTELDILPGEYQSTLQQALFGDFQDLALELRSPEYMQREYELDFPARRQAEEKEQSGEGS